ncbi:RNA polymerase I-specific transcription initiation factor RRN6-like protein [Aspergillus falconensis]
MDEHVPKSLHYGHLGKPIYHPETQSWEFLRTLVPPPRISYTGVTKTTVQSPSTSVEQSLTIKRSILSRGYPELIAGYRFAHDELLSHTIAAASRACNPLLSALLDFGRAVDFDIDPSGRRAVPIVAFASGECGNNISLRTISHDTVELEQATVTQLRVPTIGDDDRIEWQVDGAPIRQICFSHAPDERATFMAARFSSTVIFRPLYRRNPVSVPIQRAIDDVVLDHQVSRLDPNFLLEISTSHTGGAVHADVKFNPWNPSQIAIVDEDGNWGVWELRNQHKRNKDNWVASRVTSGTLPWAGVGDSQNAGARGRHDGWLAIEWAGYGNYVIVCDRRCSMLYRMEGNRAYPCSMELGFKRPSEWILGIKRSTRDPSHIFILTTSRLIWFEITPALTPVDDDTGLSIPSRLSWRHFRDSDDTTLQLAPLTINNEFYLVLFSRLSHFVLAFYCSKPPEGVRDSVSALDPFILHVPPTSVHADDSEALSMDAHFSTLVFKEIAPTTMDGQHLDHGLSFLKVFAADSSLRVRESLYSKPSTNGSGAQRMQERDVLRVRNLRLTGLQKKVIHSRSGFLVDDWDESVRGDESVSDRGIDSIAPLAEPQFTLDYTHIYAIATGVSNLLPQDSQNTTERSFQDSIQQVVDKVAGHIPFEGPSSRTVLEILRKSPALDDIDQNAQDLAAFVSQFASDRSALGHGARFLIQPYDSFAARLTRQGEPVEASRLDLIAIYDRLVNHWLIDLPSDMPGRARITKERAIRHFVADIVLSQIISVHQREANESTTNRDVASSAYSSSGLTTSSGLTDEQSFYGALLSSTDQGFQSQADTAATQSSALEDSIIPERQADQLSTFEVLSSYTRYNKTGPISPGAERLLDRWKPGLDPASYLLASEESQVATKNKTRKGKSRNNMSQALKKTSLDSPKPPLVSSLPPPVSSPAPAVRGNWSSQLDNGQLPMIRFQGSQLTDDVPMTQIERGTFGSRVASKKGGIKARKKKRAAGF